MYGGTERLLTRSRFGIVTLISCATSAYAFQRVISPVPSLNCRNIYGNQRSCHILRRRPLKFPSKVVSNNNHQQSDTAIHLSSEGSGSTEDNQEAPPSVVGLPTTRQLLTFVLTTVLVWTSEPLLSLVDSATVGTFAGRAQKVGTHANLASVVQLASLGPATMLCDSSIFLTYFIGLAATNKLSRASAKKDWKSMVEISSHSLGVSVALGALISISLFIFGGPLLRSIIGPEGAIFTDVATKSTVDLTGEVLRISLGYTWIRSIAAAFAITGSTAQSLLLCVLDTKTVTLAVVVATVLNTVGDVLLVAWKGWGVWGAAVATSVATIASNTLLIWKGRSLIKQWRTAFWREKFGEESELPSNESYSNEREVMTRQREKFKEYLILPFISLPDKDSLRSLVLLAGPIFLLMVAKLVEFWNMTIRAGHFGLISLACHNLLMRIFLFFAVFGDGVSQASQTFLPGLFVKQKSVKPDYSTNTGLNGTKLQEQKESSRSRKAYQVIRRLSAISAALGVFVGFTARWIANNAGSTFTPDRELVSLMSTTSGYMALILLLNPLAEMLEGTLIASRDVKYLLCTRGLVLALFLGTLKVSFSKFTDIWKTLFVFQLIKIATSVARIASKAKSK